MWGEFLETDIFGLNKLLEMVHSKPFTVFFMLETITEVFAAFLLMFSVKECPYRRQELTDFLLCSTV